MKRNYRDRRKPKGPADMIEKIYKRESKRCKKKRASQACAMGPKLGIERNKEVFGQSEFWLRRGFVLIIDHIFCKV